MECIIALQKRFKIGKFFKKFDDVKNFVQQLNKWDGKITATFSENILYWKCALPKLLWPHAKMKHNYGKYMQHYWTTDNFSVSGQIFLMNPGKGHLALDITCPSNQQIFWLTVKSRKATSCTIQYSIWFYSYCCIKNLLYKFNFKLSMISVNNIYFQVAWLS